MVYYYYYLLHFQIRLCFRYEMLDAASESFDKHLDTIYKHEENVISISKKWIRNTIEDLKNAEKSRYWTVIEEIRMHRVKKTVDTQT